MDERGRLTEDGDLIPVPGMTPGAIGGLPDVDPGKYWGERAPMCRCSLVPLAPDSGWPDLPDGDAAYDVTYEIDVADRTPRKQP